MDFRDISEFFGGSIFFDDFRGNLVEIRDRLDHFQLQAAIPLLDNAAMLLLLRGLWSLWSGNYLEASQLLECLTEGEVYGTRWKFRAYAHTGLLCTWREHPPLLDFCELSGPAMVTYHNQSPARKAHHAFSYCEDHLEDGSMVDIIEFRVIYEVCRVQTVIRKWALQLDPKSEDYQDPGAMRHTFSKAVSVSKSKLKGFEVLTAQLGLPATSSYLSKLLYQTTRAEGSSLAFVHLERMKLRYARNEDENGIGLYWLLRGDHNISPPKTSPLLLNFDIVDSPDEFGGDSKIHNSVEMYALDQEHIGMSETSAQGSGTLTAPHLGQYPAGLMARDKVGNMESSFSEETFRHKISVARRCYSEALIHFERAKSPRGVAVTALRQACVLTLEDIQISRCWGSPQHGSKIQDLLSVAQSSCLEAGDVQLSKLVQMHILLTIPPDLEISAVAKEIGRWAETLQNEILGLSLALLSMKAGLHFRYHCGSMSSSMMSLEISRQLIKSMGPFKVVWFQVMLAQASIAKSMGNLQHARQWNSHLLDFWRHLAFQCSTQKSGSELDSSIQLEGMGDAMVQHYLQMTVGSILSIDSKIGDPKSFPSDSTSELLNWISENSHTQKWIETQQVRIKYQKAILSYKQEIHRGKLKEANLCLKNYLADEEVFKDDLQARAYVIDIAITFGEDNIAKEVLGRILDSDVLSLEYGGFGRGSSSEVSRAEQRRVLKSLELIFLCCIKVGEWKRASHILTLLEDASPGYFTSVTGYTKLWPWQRCLYAGLVYEQEKRYNLSMQYFLQSWVFIGREKNDLGTQEDKRRLWEIPDVARLVGSVVRRSLRWLQDQPNMNRLTPSSDPRIDTRIFLAFAMDIEYGKLTHEDDVLLLLETGRAQHVWETITSQTKTDNQILIANYKYQTWMELKGMHGRTPEEEQELEQLDRTKEEWTSQLRDRMNKGKTDNDPDDASSLREKTRSLTIYELYEAIPERALVIYTALSDDGLALFAVDRTGIRHSEVIPVAGPVTIRVLVCAYIAEVIAGKGNPDSAVTQDSDLSLQAISGILGSILLKPVEKYIDANDHVIFVPSGDLMRFPLGALLFKKAYLIMQKQVSQVPSLSTLRALRRTRQEQTSTGTNKVSVMSKPGNTMKSSKTSERALPMASIEAKMIASLTGTTALNVDNVTRTEFQGHMRGSDILHICTHGYSDAEYPLRSYISLKERFRTIDMLTVRTEVALVVFSSCLSGTGQASNSGDLQGFSHAVLAAGANAYLGALWNANDVATMIHMYYFYLILLVALEEPSLSEAWQFATKLLYELTPERAVELLRQFIRNWDVWDERCNNPNKFVRRDRRRLEDVIRTLETEGGRNMLNFNHPYIWAPFVMVGNGSLLVVGSSRRNQFLELSGVDELSVRTKQTSK